MRDKEIEERLQNSLDNGNNVWVIGDVHGHFATFKALIESLRLSKNDCVVMLGDLIDRGPTSANVVKFVREAENIFSVKGNHEQMMIDGFSFVTFFKENNRDGKIWYHEGGVNTEYSYIRLYDSETESYAAASSDKNWMAKLPTEIVLDNWRLVHAGYDQNFDADNQDEQNHLWIRAKFYTAKKAIDPSRTILFGHTPAFRHLHKDDTKTNLAWYSDVKLDDGRSMAIGIDTCVYHKLKSPKVLTAFNLQTQETYYQDYVRD